MTPSTAADPTPSQLMMMISWERELRGETSFDWDDAKFFANLIPHVVGSALLALRDEGAISIEYASGRKLGIFPAKHLVVKRTGSTAFPSTSFEGQLWAKLGEESAPIRRLVSLWVGGAVANPYEAVRERGNMSLVEAGLLTSEQKDARRGAVGRALRGNTQTIFHPQPRAIDLLPKVQALRARFANPDRGEAGLDAQVVKETRRAIINSTKTVSA